MNYQEHLPQPCAPVPPSLVLPTMDSGVGSGSLSFLGHEPRVALAEQS